MANLLIITQKVDENDDLLGSFICWIDELAKYFNRVHVIALAKGAHHLPKNVFVHSLGKEYSRSKLLQFFKLYYLLLRFVPSSVGVFAHMSPIFAIAAAPITKLAGKKLILWYLHRSLTTKLKLANFLSDYVVTAAKESLNLKSGKIIELGHGIDLNFFKAERNWAVSPNGKLKFLSVGRISPIKNYETLLAAAKILKDREIDFEIKIVGRPIMKYDFPYFESLRSLIQKYDLRNYIQFLGMVPYKKIPPLYQGTDLMINLAPKGGLDRTVLEAMATRMLILTSNMAFKQSLGQYADNLIFKYGDSSNLADKILKLMNLPPAEKQKRSEFLFHSVSENHNLEKLIERIVGLYKINKKRP